jgi:hypothetical protein
LSDYADRACPLTDDAPIVCKAPVDQAGIYPGVDCPGYTTGTSGSPWLSDFDPASKTRVLTGVIGGLDPGGCLPDTSYTSP